MKIAMIGQKGIAIGAGGVERHVEEISSRLVEKGNDVTVYYRSTAIKDDIKEYKGIKLKRIITVRAKSLDAIVYSLKATISALIEGFDIYHYHALGPASVSIIPKLLGKKVVVTVHGLDWQRDKWGNLAKLYLKFGEFISGKFSDKLISVSDSVASYMSEKYKRNKNDVSFIPNGVNVFTKIKPNLIKKYGLEEDKYILFLARLVPEKGVHYLIEAFNDLNTDIKLVIAGGSSFTDGYVSRLHDMAKGNERVVFTGNVQGQMLKELYSNCLFYVLPSDIEGMPLTLLEALSYGKFAVVSDIKENTHIIKDRYGVKFKKGDIRDLRMKLDYALRHIKEYKDKEEEIIKNITSNYNWNAVTDKVLQVYEECKTDNEKSICMS